jgi:hypothetical protein
VGDSLLVSSALLNVNCPGVCSAAITTTFEFLDVRVGNFLKLLTFKTSISKAFIDNAGVSWEILALFSVEATVMSK